MTADQNSSFRSVAAWPGTVLLALFLGGCPPPGKGAKAEAGYRRAAPVIVALDRYHQERGSYPESLAELPPSPDPPPQGLKYVRRGDHYELSFSYTGPGVNHCSYDAAAPAPQRWQCSGYY